MDGNIFLADELNHNSPFPPALPKTVVVAGGAGFVGSHLCQKLVSAGNRVICVDSLITGRRSNIAQLIGHPLFRFIEADITSPVAIEGPVQQVYNLACPASPPLYQADPIHTFRTCVMGSLNLLELAKQKKARILLASTSEVYGDPEISPQPESYRGNVNTVGPRACYDEGKRAAETLVLGIWHPSGRRNPDSTDFQHVWPSNEPGRRARCVELHRAGADRGRPDHLW